MLKRLLIICFCFLMGLQPLSAQQPTREELQKQQQELLRELADLNKDLHSIQKDKKAALGAYAVVKRKIDAQESLIRNINRSINLLTETIYQNQLEIYRLRKELDTLKIQYAQSLVFAYKNRGSYDYLNFLFSAQSFNDAIKRMTYLKSYRQFRETQAETINKTEMLLQSSLSRLNNNRKEKSSVLDSQSSQLKVLEDDKKEKDQVVKQLKDQEKDVAAEIRKREKDQLRLRSAITAALKRAAEEAEKEKRRLAQQQKEAKEREASDRENARNNPAKLGASKSETGANNTGSVSNETVMPKSDRAYSTFESTKEGLIESLNFEHNRGRLPWPIDGGMMYIPFGRQQIPGTKIIVDNQGIDIKTNVGATVKCVADGEVTAVMDLEQYQVVMVKHGKYFTAYNMLATVSVKKGDEVKAGTVLGKVAPSMDGDGQFEFQVFNDRQIYQNPENWLKRR